MNDNQLHIDKATEMIRIFEENPRQKHTSHLLNEAAKEVGKIEFISKNKTNKYEKDRHSFIFLSFNILRLLDKYYIPNYIGPEVYLYVMGPPINGIQFGAVNLDKISDPELRAEYAKKVEDNKRNLIELSLQESLKQLDNSRYGDDPKYGFEEKTKEYISVYFTADENDQEELKSAIDSIIVNKERKASLYQLLKN